jgi:hypothetical protein
MGKSLDAWSQGEGVRHLISELPGSRWRLACVAVIPEIPKRRLPGRRHRAHDVDRIGNETSALPRVIGISVGVTFQHEMFISVPQSRLRLSRHDHLRLRGARMVRLTAVNGFAWVTARGKARDTVITPGDSFVVSTARGVLIGPLFASVTLDIHDMPSAAMCATFRLTALGAKCRSIRRRLRRLVAGAM